MDIPSIFGHGNKYVHLLMFEKYLGSSSVSNYTFFKSYVMIATLLKLIVIEVVYLSQEDYVAPPIPTFCPDFADIKSRCLSFGKEYLSLFNIRKVSLQWVTCWIWSSTLLWSNHVPTYLTWVYQLLRPFLHYYRNSPNWIMQIHLAAWLAHWKCLRLVNLFKNVNKCSPAISQSFTSRQEFQIHMDTHPRKVIDRETVPLIAYVIREMADFVHCDPLDLVLIESTQLAISTILKSLHLSHEDTVLSLNTGCGE